MWIERMLFPTYGLVRALEGAGYAVVRNRSYGLLRYLKEYQNKKPISRAIEVDDFNADMSDAVCPILSARDVFMGENYVGSIWKLDPFNVYYLPGYNGRTETPNGTLVAAEVIAARFCEVRK